MDDAARPITIANDDTLDRFIRDTSRRLVFLGPAVSTRVAEALADRWRTLGRENVSVILDVHPEVYRLGYGDPEGLEILQKVADSLGASIRFQPGIRIGVVVADDSTLVFSPTPQLIEAGPTRYDAPNAILITDSPSPISAALGGGGDPALVQVGHTIVRADLVEKVKADLVQNPPQSFNIARTVRVFNAFFEFVEFELQGAFIERRVVSIPSDLMGLARDEKTQRLLKASFRLVDDAADLSGKPLQKAKANLMKDYLTLLPGYGHVVLRNVKPHFERKVRQFQLAVKRFQRRIETSLQQAMDANRTSLLEALLPAVREHPPKRWRKYLAGTPNEAILRRLLDEDLLRSFGTAKDTIKEMKVNLLFKAVTYESLNDPAFMQIAKEKLPSIEQLYDEYNAAQAKESRS